MNDEELQEMLHHIHILKKTEVTDQINFEEFYTIITAPRKYWWRRLFRIKYSKQMYYFL